MHEIQLRLFDAETLAEQLLLLRNEGRAQQTSQFSVPPDLASGIHAQQKLASLEGATGMAVKVALTPDGHPVTAPLHPYLEAFSSAELAYKPGMRFEVEIALRLGADLPVRADGYTRAEIVAAIAQVHLGAELLFTAVEESGRISYPLYLADRIGNCGYVFGPALPRSALDLDGGMVLDVSFDGSSLHAGAAMHPAGDVLAWFTSHANDRTRATGSLVSGMVITTGALSGAMPIPAPGTVDVLLDGKYSLQVTLTP